MNVEDIAVCVSIPQAAKVLNVTDKTVRNYIDRGLLSAEKWNGSWRIQKEDLIEIYYKKYGKKMVLSAGGNETHFVRIPIGEYDGLQRRAGRLEAGRQQVEELKAELELAQRKVIELESSSASGWTEARTHREEREVLEKKLDGWRQRERESDARLLSCTEKLDGIREGRRECLDEIERLKEENGGLKKRLGAQGKGRKRRREKASPPRRRRERNRLKRVLRAFFSSNSEGD